MIYIRLTWKPGDPPEGKGEFLRPFPPLLCNFSPVSFPFLTFSICIIFITVFSQSRCLWCSYRSRRQCRGKQTDNVFIQPTLEPSFARLVLETTSYCTQVGSRHFLERIFPHFNQGWAFGSGQKKRNRGSIPQIKGDFVKMYILDKFFFYVFILLVPDVLDSKNQPGSGDLPKVWK